MSNLIKYPFVDMRGKETKVISYEKEEKFVPLEKGKKVIKRSLEEVENAQALEKESLASKRPQENDKKDGNFKAAPLVTNFDEMFQKKQEEAEKEAAAVLENARAEAETLLSEARGQAEEIRETAHQEGIALGREEGNAQAAEELDRLRAELLEQGEEQKRQYQELIRGTEGRYVEILCDLLRKLTGVIVTDKQDIILHLIRSGIADMEPAKKYIIRVCPEDMIYVESSKEDIMDKTGITGILEVQEEKGLLEGECIIETDTQMIDCGFRTQLDNMISTLRMLA